MEGVWGGWVAGGDLPRVLVQQCGFKEAQRPEARGREPGEASGSRASLTFYHRHTKKGRAGGSILSRLCAQQVGGRIESSMETADGKREPSKVTVPTV